MIASDTTVNILGFQVTTLSREEMLELAHRWIRERRASHHLMALNPIKVCRARNEPVLARHIQDADLVYPDAYGIAWAMKKFSGKKYPTIPGCDLMLDIMDLASKNSLRVFLLGSTPPVLADACALFQKLFTGANIAGVRHGFFTNDEEKRKVTDDILACEPDILFVGMGALIQENWITRISDAAMENNTVIPLCMGVGGSFDAVTGHVARPPRWMLRMHLEWLFRLLQQPFRAPRMFALPHFALLVLAKRLFGIPTDYSWDIQKSETPEPMQKVEA